jgi:hypothetical protein
MKKYFLLSWLIAIVALSILSTGCPPSVDQRIKEESHIGALDEATHSRDLAIRQAIEASILADPALQWYAKTYGPLTVDVSHAVATVTMKVKTQEQHDQVYAIAKGMKDCRDVVDNITIDPKLDDPPFEW